MQQNCTSQQVAPVDDVRCLNSLSYFFLPAVEGLRPLPCEGSEETLFGMDLTETSLVGPLPSGGLDVSLGLVGNMVDSSAVESPHRARCAWRREPGVFPGLSIRSAYPGAMTVYPISGCLDRKGRSFIEQDRQSLP